jgi:hypothetical protein
MLHTAGMEYVFKTDKASRLLGYQPVYSVDQAIQVCCTALLRVATKCPMALAPEPTALSRNRSAPSRCEHASTCL